MKVLKNNDYVEFTCPKCKSVLGVHCDDIKYDEMQGTLITCVVCGHNCQFPENLIPNRWRSIIFAGVD